MSLSLLLITTIPVFLGIFINIKFSIFVEKIHNFYSIFSLILFSIVIFAALHSEWDIVVGLYKRIGFLVILLAVVVFITSYTFVNLLGLDAKNKKTIIIESFIQNAAMAIIVGEAVFGRESGYLAIAVLYALLQYKLLILFWAISKFLKKFNRS